MASFGSSTHVFGNENMNASKPSVFRSFMPSRKHKKSTSVNDIAISQRPKSMAASMLPPDHPHSHSHRPLAERDLPNASSVQWKAGYKGPAGGLHKKTKSSVSLKSLLMDKDKKGSSSKDRNNVDDGTASYKPKKSKSSTSLSGIFRRPQRDRKGEAGRKEKDKENTAPQHTAENEAFPIWSQYPTEEQEDQYSRRYGPRNERSLDEEMSLYTPKGYSPSKQRNFFDFHQPVLTKRKEVRPRPMSDYISSGSFSSKSILASGGHSRQSSRGSHDGPISKPRHPSTEVEKSSEAGGKRGSRVMAVINAFNAKEKATQPATEGDIGDIDSAFEELLDSRNIPHNMRDKMRSLDATIKADFIKKHRVEHGSSSSSASSQAQIAKFGSSKRIQKELPATPAPEEHDYPTEKKGSKSRGRGRAFTIGKESSSKREKSSGAHSHKRPISIDLSRPSSSRGLPSPGLTGVTSPIQPDSAADPADFVHYLKEVRKPEIIEVGKLHKLRILLRNETVAWVDTFISQGGMDEVVDLVYRIMQVEWREEHEDTLLHETLLCVKALCTTSLAIRGLASIAPTLFPRLLGMLFDKDKKGPSEFTTRGIILNLLFTHLESSPRDELPSRAKEILSYMRDPAPPEEAQPLTFIASIYQPRPYCVWCKEVSNVTKEVFWIFLHHLNVVPISQPDVDTTAAPQPFATQYFPPPRPPVPAAPYVGGVEWDATNYFANHLDLINGLLAALPTTEERNSLRADLRASGFEKVMGGSLRTCKEKFYPAVHDGLRLWVSAAIEDGWDYLFVREGPPRDAGTCMPKSPIKSPKKGGVVSEEAPKLDLNVGITSDVETKPQNEDFTDWL
ncbi:hypothetical protein AJ80_09258 [Polytolypa hystricis UAMH7299]|uniref:Formin GTPase-binding domain-containing protein n=1 Tax=Polytolypa hystricis (strain UAMH7299) TaxID=1447883 RepID=A0A2B7WTP9_POLH7|nr:hypothetical protein AJ80_09258 [Polytolypa hystricis UAMH7299]